MKTYLFDTIERYRRFSESLDVKVVICNKSWSVFNDSGEKEIYIFQEDGSLIISNNGKVTNGTWKYIPANKSIIINGNSQSYMLHPAFMDELLFALQVDGTQQCAFLIDENNKKSFEPKNYSELLQYFHSKEQLEMDKKREEKQKIENDKKLIEKIRRADNPLDYISKEHIVCRDFKDIRVKIGDTFIDIPTGNKYLEEYEEFPQIKKTLKRKHYYLLKNLVTVFSFWFFINIGLLLFLLGFAAIGKASELFGISFMSFMDDITFDKYPILSWVLMILVIQIPLGLIVPCFFSSMNEKQYEAIINAGKEVGIDIPSSTILEYINRDSFIIVN